MTEIESLYRKEGGRILIEINLSAIGQLFNSFDPSPFHEKELDAAAEEYIVDIVDDFPADTLFKIRIHLPAGLCETEEAGQIIPAVRHHFRYKAIVTEQKFRARFRHGRWAMLIGLPFLAIALIARQFISIIDNHIAGMLLADALLIIGWAAMWEPVTVLLYELWPIRQLKKIYERISTMDMEIIPIP